MSFSKFVQVAGQRLDQPKTAAFGPNHVLKTLTVALEGATKYQAQGKYSVSNTELSYTVSVMDGNVLVAIAAKDKAKATEAFNELKKLFKQKHMKKVLRPERGTGFLSGKRMSGLWTINTVLLPPTGHITVLTDQMLRTLDENTDNAWGGYLYSISRVVMDHGFKQSEEWEYKEEEADTMDEVIHAVSDHHWTNVNSDGSIMCYTQEYNEDIDLDPEDYDGDEDAYERDMHEDVEYRLEVTRGDKKPLTSEEKTYLQRILRD